MKTLEIPYTHFEDEHTRELKRKQPDVVDPDVYHARLLWECPGGPYLLNNKNRDRFRRGGPLGPPYYPASLLEDRYAGRPAFIFAPGPSMAEADLDVFRGKLTIALNSAGFRFVEPAPLPFLWAMFESNYVYWLLDQDEAPIPPNRVYIMSARCALPWRAAGKTSRLRAAFVPQWEESKAVPPRVPAVCTFASIVGAWAMGCSCAYLVGMDLSKPGKPYVDGVPYSKVGAANPFDDQVRCLRQLRIPGFPIYNASPHSKKFDLPFEPVDVRDVEKVARDSPSPEYPAEVAKKR